MEQSMQAKHSQIYGTKLGCPTMMQVRFREVEPTNLWLWFEMVQPPSDKERQMLQEVGACIPSAGHCDDVVELRTASNM